MSEASSIDVGREHARTSNSSSGFVRGSGSPDTDRYHGLADPSAGSGA